MGLKAVTVHNPELKMTLSLTSEESWAPMTP